MNLTLLAANRVGEQTITLLNSGASNLNTAGIEIIALDRNGVEIERATLAPFAAMESRSLTMRELFSVQPERVAAVRAVSDALLAGLQMTIKPDGAPVDPPSVNDKSSVNDKPSGVVNQPEAALAAAVVSASGLVTMNNGTAFAGVTISFYVSAGTGALPPAVQTDASGNWTQSGFTAGATYGARPGYPAYAFTPSLRFFNESFGGLDFVGALAPLYTVSGVVTTINSVAIPGVTLTFALVTGTGVIPMASLSRRFSADAG